MEIRKTGLFFNFVSDPMLPETFLLNAMAMRLCVTNNIPVKILTKQTWWVDEFIREEKTNGTIWNCTGTKNKFYIGFTLTGHDELEPGAARNIERLIAIHKLKIHGFKTWASIEPIIDFESAKDMISFSYKVCDLFKVGLMSGKKYDVVEAQSFVEWLDELQQPKIYLKESLQKLTKYTNEELDEYFVDPNYLW
jgi:DNA repair photolyase